MNKWVSVALLAGSLAGCTFGSFNNPVGDRSTDRIGSRSQGDGNSPDDGSSQTGGSPTSTPQPQPTVAPAGSAEVVTPTEGSRFPVFTVRTSRGRAGFYSRNFSIDLILQGELPTGTSLCVSKGTSDCSHCRVDTELTLDADLLNYPIEFDQFGKQTLSVRLIDSASGQQSACASVTAELKELAVKPRYSSAPKWNDYVKSAAITQPCEGSEPLAADCVHGGEARVVETVERSCEGVSLTDALGAFEWQCELNPGTHSVQLVSQLKKGKGLQHLLQYDQRIAKWKTNSITLTIQQNEQYPIAALAWWDNPVKTPAFTQDQPITLSEAGTIYLLPYFVRTPEVRIEADRIALVVGENQTLQQSTVSGPPPRAPFVSAGRLDQDGSRGEIRRFVWIEGIVDAPYAYPAVALYQNQHSRLHRLISSNTTGAPFLAALQEGNGSILSEISGTGLPQKPLPDVASGSRVSIGPATYQGFEIRNSQLSYGRMPPSVSVTGSRGVIRGLTASNLLLSQAPGIKVEDLTIDSSAVTAGYTGVVLEQSPGARFKRFQIKNTHQAASDPNGLTIGIDSHDGVFMGGLIESVSKHGVAVHASQVRLDQVTVRRTIGDGVRVESLPRTDKSPVIRDITLSRVLAYDINRHPFAIVAVEAGPYTVQGVNIVQSTGARSMGNGLLAMNTVGLYLHHTVLEASQGGHHALTIWDSSRYFGSDLILMNPQSGTGTAGQTISFQSTRSEGRVLGKGKFSKTLRIAGTPNCSPDSQIDDLASSLALGLNTECQREGNSDSVVMPVAINGVFRDRNSQANPDFRLVPENEFILAPRGLASAEGEILSSPSTSCPLDATEEVSRLGYCTTDASKTSASECSGLFVHGGPALRAALEKVGDEKGDDDGFCETGESCLYSPKSGHSIEGETNTWSSCVFSGSPRVQEVRLEVPGAR